MTATDIGPRELAGAIGRGEIRPIYMNLVDLGSQKVVACEALARWYRPSGVVPPDHFIPMAEATGLIRELDLAVAGQAMAELASWQLTDPGMRVTVNLSGHHFVDTDSVGRLVALTAENGVAPSSVILELTETVRADDVELAVEIAQQLRGHGFSLWLDDFGSGYAGLHDLLRYPVDGIKIDRPFAARLSSTTADAVIQATAGLALRLGLSVTIEGIEHRHQADRALALGCQIGQGFLWPRG
jgi:EAL domain-containing protein (putative c-di-GMP-specific phosphodiesterase class I)